MEVITEISSLREFLDPLRIAGKSICLVPTMGNLHAGHLSLVEEAKTRGDIIVTSLYVNPLQFGPGEDLDSYPRTFDRDRNLLEQYGCHCLFAPDTDELFPGGPDSATVVHVPELTESHCGVSRPGHFDGVATIVSRLFNIVAPQVAIFGLKDYQQFLVIRKMVQDLAFDIEIVGVETVREKDGLAMSSRNNYLDQQEKNTARQLYNTLEVTRQAVLGGRRDYPALEDAAREILLEAGLQPDYFSICDAHNLQAPTENSKQLAILGAVFLGKTRLIDNLRFDLS